MMEWKEVTLEDIVESNVVGLVRGSKEQGHDLSHWYVKMNNITNDGKLDLANCTKVNATAEELEKYSLAKGDLLFNTRNSTELVGKSCIYNEEEQRLYNNNIMRIRFKEQALPDFVQYHLYSKKTRQNLAKLVNSTTNVAAIYYKNLRKLKLTLPPLETQHHIAQILDTADALRQKDQALLKQYDELAQGLFLEMFGEALVQKQNFEPIGELVKFIDYRGKTPVRLSTGVPLINAKCVRVGYFDKNRIDYISEETYNKTMTRGFPKPGDVLFTTEGATLGFTCRIPAYFDRFAVGQRIITLQCDERYNSVVLEYVLNSRQVQEEIFKKATGSAAKGIRSALFAKIKIPLPPISLQNQFAERIEAIEAQKVVAQRAAQQSEDLFQALLQRAFKGELNP